MRKSILWPATALLAVLVLVGASRAQPPGRRGGPPGPFGGPGTGIQRALDDLQLPETKRTAADVAVRAYLDDGRRLTELAGAQLLIQMKEVLSPDDFKKVREAAAPARPGRDGAARAGWERTPSSSAFCPSIRIRTARSPRKNSRNACST